MSRFDRRASRPLIVVLGLVIALAAFSIFHNRDKGIVNRIDMATAHQEQQASQPDPTPAPPVLPPTHAAFVPATHPSTRPYLTLFGPSALQLPQLASSLNTPATVPSANLLTRAKEKVDAGKVIDARTELNDALQSGNLNESDAQAAKAMISEINKTAVFGKKHFADDAYTDAYVVKSGDALAKIATAHDCTADILSTINGIPDARHLRSGATIKVVQGPFFAVVSKKAFTMDLYLGGLPGEKSSMYVTSYAVGLGRDDSTPLGTWMIEPQHKLKHPTYYSPRGEGVIAADDPKNPLGGYWIGLTGTEGQALGRLSYGIHGTIEPDSIGKQSSMGCIRMHNEDVAVVFELLVEGKSLVMVKE